MPTRSRPKEKLLDVAPIASVAPDVVAFEAPMASLSSLVHVNCLCRTTSPAALPRARRVPRAATKPIRPS